MEKTLRIAVGVLGMGLHTAARANEVTLPPNRPMIVSVASPLLPLPGRVQPVNPLFANPPIVENTIEQPGHTEIAGAAIIGFAALWSARRRRIV